MTENPSTDIISIPEIKSLWASNIKTCRFILFDK